MSLERILSAVAGGIVTALLGAAGISVAQRGAEPSVPAPQCAAVVENLAHVQAGTRAEADRCACKYRHAKGAALARGAALPTTREGWDAVCAESDEAARVDPPSVAAR